MPARDDTPPETRPHPPYRRLATYAFDPSLDLDLETARINQVILRVPWEDLEPGPVGEYLEVVDADPASDAFYPPVDLNDPFLLAQDGLSPTERDPGFHQQMVYAVAMTTIRNFERALGRAALWSPRLAEDEDGELHDEFVRRLRIYPHALREANAFYSPAKKALLFGYFPASRDRPGVNLPGGTVFTCLSHDIVAHETTHALLDGMHRRFSEATNVDVLALHEAFSDIVALFQHFSFPEVLKHQVARTRGDLGVPNLLAELARQFGQALGRSGALRDALGSEPDPEAIHKATEPHARGALLVAAVFDAFVAIYKYRTTDLIRIATGGTGVLPPGAIHPDLVGRLTTEASKAARHTLSIAIRALEYCPPVDITFGDYLRALITADADLVPDQGGYRIAFIDAFRRRGIYPHDVRSLSVDNLRWLAPGPDEQAEFVKVFRGPERVQKLTPDWDLASDREEVYKQTRKSRAILHGWLISSRGQRMGRLTGLRLDADAPRTIDRDSKGRPLVEVHAVRPSHRVGPEGGSITDLVVEITQRRRGYFDRDVQRRADAGEVEPPPPDFWFRGGCTLLVDLETGKVRYAVGKGIGSDRRLETQRRFLTAPLAPSLRATYFADPRTSGHREPFALLHRSFDEQEVP